MRFYRSSDFSPISAALPSASPSFSPVFSSLVFRFSHGEKTRSLSPIKRRFCSTFVDSYARYIILFFHLIFSRLDLHEISFLRNFNSFITSHRFIPRSLISYINLHDNFIISRFIDLIPANFTDIPIYHFNWPWFLSRLWPIHHSLICIFYPPIFKYFCISATLMLIIRSHYFPFPIIFVLFCN